MRVYDLMLVVFLFTLSLSIVYNIETTYGLYGGGVSMDSIGGVTSKEYLSTEITGVTTLSEEATKQGILEQTFGWFGNFWRMVIGGIKTVIRVFWDCTLGLPNLLESIGVPSILAIPLGIAANLIYLIGMLQWMMGKSFKEHA
jgi:hypothetical protein